MLRLLNTFLLHKHVVKPSHTTNYSFSTFNMPHHHHVHGQQIAHTRIPLVKNELYKRSGIKSYVWLLQKCESVQLS